MSTTEASAPKRSFWWGCAVKAATGCVSFANDWQWLLGLPAAAAALGWALGWGRSVLLFQNHPILAPMAFAAAGFLLTWPIKFVYRVGIVAPEMWREEKARADKLEEHAARKPLEIVFKRGPSFHRVIIGPDDGQDWLIALHNTTHDTTIRDVGLCVTECSWMGNMPIPLWPVGKEKNIKPQQYLFYKFASYRNSLPNWITLCREMGGESFGFDALRVRVEAFAENAHAQQWFDIALADNGLNISPETGEWEHKYEVPVVVTVVPNQPAKDVPSPAILAGEWIFEFAPASAIHGRKKLTFNADGTIGMGQNKNEDHWEMETAGTLAIWRHDGTLQNRFRYDEKQDRFICTNDSTAVGLKDQSIYRPQLQVSG